MSTLNSKTPCLVTEVNPHRQSSTVWTGATTVADVIAIVEQTTAFKVTQPGEFLLKNARQSLENFIGADGDFDGDAYNAWETAQPIDAHFEAAIDCARDDGHTVSVYWTREAALDAGAPRYMSDEQYIKAVDLVF